MGPSGMTLLELTIVITVLLLFLGMTYIGVRAWKRGRTDPPA
jgi:prepilin-type N-terminal cleavage/methylation domain-containing protein